MTKKNGLPKLTDDVRILVVLREGGTVRNFYRAGFKFSRAPEYWCSVDGPGADDKRFRLISMSALDRCYEAGLIIGDGVDDMYRRDITYALTEAGISAAAALDFTMDQALAAPKPRPAKPEMTDEEKKEAKRRGYARKDLAFLAKGGRLVHSSTGWRFHRMDKPFIEPPQRWGEWIPTCRNLDLISHLVEEFVAEDGVRSIRIAPSGSEIIAKRRPLTCA